MLYDYVTQLKRYTYACCVTKYFPWLDSSRKGIPIFHYIYYFFFSLSKLSSCFYTTCAHYFIITFSGDDCQPRLCHVRNNNSRCITYNAWWQILAYSCYWQRCHLISVSIFEYHTATLYATCLKSSLLWTDGQIAACLDVLQLTHATIQLVIPNSILLELSYGVRIRVSH